MKHLTKSEERNARAKRNVAREIEYFNMQKNGPGEDAKAYFERYIRPHGKDSGQEGEMAETAAESAGDGSSEDVKPAESARTDTGATPTSSS